MNSTSGTLLTDKLVPFLNTLPAQAGPIVSKFKQTIANNPEGLFQMLFNPKTLKQMPPELSNQMVPILKTSLMDSLHSVFFVGLWFVVAGAVCTLFLKQIHLSNKKGEKESKLKNRKKVVATNSN
jgi:hypothetical protein